MGQKSGRKLGADEQRLNLTFTLLMDEEGVNAISHEFEIYHSLNKQARSTKLSESISICRCILYNCSVIV